MSLRLFFVDELSKDSPERKTPLRAEPALRKPAIQVSQAELFPQSLNDLVDQSDPVRLVSGLIDLLDVSELMAELPLKGGVNYDPRLMLKLWMFALWDGERSSRRIEKRCKYDNRYRWLCGGLIPDHTTLCRFRRRLGNRLDDLLVQSVKIARKKGMGGLGRASLDGTKLPSAASQWRRFRKESEDSDASISNEEHPVERPLPPSTDPDAKSMRSRSGQFIFGYNVQSLVDCDDGLVMAVDVSNEVVDMNRLSPTLEHCLALHQDLPAEILADSGYDSSENAQILAELGIVGWISSRAKEFIWSVSEEGEIVCPAGDVAVKQQNYATQGVSLQRTWVTGCRQCSLYDGCHDKPDRKVKTLSYRRGVDPRHWVEQTLRSLSSEGKQAALERCQTVELCFARIKRILGLRRLHLFGIQGAKTEVKMAALALNLMTLAKHFSLEDLRTRIFTIKCLLLIQIAPLKRISA